MSAILGTWNVTTFLVGEYTFEETLSLPEFAAADGMIWLYAETRGTRMARFLRVLKMRGVDHSTAAHNFEITIDGISVFTLEGLIPVHMAPYGEEQTKTGLPELDDLLRGGIPRGAPPLITGGAGSGKTTLCLQYIYEGATRYGEKGIYFSYEEPAALLIANAQGFG